MASPTEQDIIDVVASKQRAERDIEYANSIKLDTQQIEGTRYKFRMSEAE